MRNAGSSFNDPDGAGVTGGDEGRSTEASGKGRNGETFPVRNAGLLYNDLGGAGVNGGSRGTGV